MENRRSREGFALLEVVVALALLSVAALGIASTLEAALRALGRAESARRALAAADAAAHTAISPSPGWQPVSTGPGGGEAVPAPPCRRRVSRGTAPSDWLWIEVRCGPDLPAPGASPASPAVAGAVRLAVPR